ncbi:HK97 gp10 family phage protein [Arthrobacter sp. fls2-241-R2A-172]|uniref:HK97 gp10 family phage protein n=1 Tax=Arthrobacter sp. fls2-241-R2A-172 TaxID=3040325 RepID=UPI002550211B|nr:HK97 gp10 family phage protein [Arthrobacter sp. fls2-241-R2A-172]
MKWNESFFSKLGHSGPVTSLVKQKAEEVQAAAQASAPVDTGEYRDNITVRIKSSGNRNVALVVAEDPKSMIIESRTGNLVRALNSVKRG